MSVSLSPSVSLSLSFSVSVYVCVPKSVCLSVGTLVRACVCIALARLTALGVPWAKQRSDEPRSSCRRAYAQSASSTGVGVMLS